MFDHRLGHDRGSGMLTWCSLTPCSTFGCLTTRGHWCSSRVVYVQGGRYRPSHTTFLHYLRHWQMFDAGVSAVLASSCIKFMIRFIDTKKIHCSDAGWGCTKASNKRHVYRKPFRHLGHCGELRERCICYKENNDSRTEHSENVSSCCTARLCIQAAWTMTLIPPSTCPA